VPFPGPQAGPVDDWSHRIFESLRDWELARDSQWTRWEPGYLLLEISKGEKSEIEPIKLYTADRELTLEFGGWETHNPAPYEFWGAEPEVIATYAKALVERWLNGEVKTAVLTNASGQWCGSSIVESVDLSLRLQAIAYDLRDQRPARIEVRTPTKRDWSIYPVPEEWLRSTLH
jgi:hypothetical protein